MPLKNKFFHSILFRLITIVASLILIGGTVGILVTGFVIKKDVKRIINEQQLEFAKYVANDIDVEIKKSLAFFSNFARNFPTDLFHHPSDKESWLKALKNVPHIFKYGIIVISPDEARVIAEYPIMQGRRELSFEDSDWFQTARVADGAICSKPFETRVSHEPAVVFAAPIKNENDAVLGVVAGALSLNQPELFRYVYRLAKENSSDIYVISPQDALFVAASIPEKVLQRTPLAGQNRLHDQAMKGYRGVGVTTSVAGVQILAAIAGIESTGWFVVVRQPLQKAYLPVKRLFESLWIYMSLFVFVVTLIIALALCAMLAPLKKTAQAVNAMAHGHRPLEKLPVMKADEIGDLVDGFNGLVDTIDKRTEKLAQSRDDLEKNLIKVKKLSGLLPICSFCKKIRDDQGYWNQIESYIRDHSEADFSHSICRECAKKYYPDLEIYED